MILVRASLLLMARIDSDSYQMTRVAPSSMSTAKTLQFNMNDKIFIELQRLPGPLNLSLLSDVS